MPGQLTPHRFESLDALRGICALMVALFHIPIYHALKGTSGFANLQACVDLFFVLSGFVLCHAFADRLTDAGAASRFMVMRFARLWPLHIAVLVLFVGIEVTKLMFMKPDAGIRMDSVPFGQGHSLWELVTNLFFLQSFGLHPDLSWNGPAWSAAVEFFVSILFAVVVLLFPKRRGLVFAVLCIAAGALLYRVSPTNLFVSFDWGFLRATFGFFLGCLVYGVRMRSDRRLPGATAVEIACLVAVIACTAMIPAGGWQYAFPLLAAVMIYVFSFDGGAVSQALRASWLQKLGLWSYSIYMTHVFIFVVVKMAMSFVSQKFGLNLVGWHLGEKLVLLGTPDQAILPAIVLSVVLVVPFAALTYRWIEKPALDAARRAVSTRRSERHSAQLATTQAVSP